MGCVDGVGVEAFAEAPFLCVGATTGASLRAGTGKIVGATPIGRTGARSANWRFSSGLSAW